MKFLELKLPPPLVVLLLGAAMWYTAPLVPALALAIPMRPLLALGFAGLGLALMLAAVLTFRMAGTTVNPLRPDTTSAVVASGVYRICRNPIYLGDLLLLAAWAVYLAHALAFLFLPVFVLYLNRFQIVPEERALLTRFGDEYTAYLRAVRRWL